MNIYKIPEELQTLPQWVCAKADCKIPMKAWCNEPASSVNPDTLSDFRGAVESPHD
jgi:primase-polymerase (primpol)-like protein